MSNKSHTHIVSPFPPSSPPVQQTPHIAEKLVAAMFRIPRLMKLYDASNPLLAECLSDFRRALAEMCDENGCSTLRIHRGRFYVDEDRMAYDMQQGAIISKMIDCLQDREIQGLRFYLPPDEIPTEEILIFISDLMKAEVDKDPSAWLQLQLDEKDIMWVHVMVDHDLKVPALQRSHDMQAGKSYSYALITMARKTYSNALTSIMNMTAKLAVKNRAGIQRSKRVIQNMIEMLMEDESILLGMSTIRNYDDYTYTHSVNVSILAMCIGRRMGLSREELGHLGLCGLFHDLGKVDLPLELIQKPASLTEEEYAIIKKHPLNSVKQIIRLNADYALKSKLVLSPFEHHLGINLKGYPRSSRREPISLYGRILAVADQYDAMTSNRGYRKAPISPDTALRLMVNDAGTVLDPLILKIFIDMVGIYPVGTLAVMDTGEVGVVIETPPNSVAGRPMVRLLIRESSNKIKKGEKIDLAEKNPNTGEYVRTIAGCFHPADYGIQAAAFLL